MKTFIVLFSFYVPCGCPDYKPDQFGRYPTTTCLVMHYELKNMSKEFNDKDSATSFYNDALKDGSLRNVQLVTNKEK